MSSYTTTTAKDGIPVVITQGWDPVLHRFFLVIEKETDCGAPTYSNLDRNISEADYQNLDYFKKIARTFGVFDLIPVGHWNKMRVDQVDSD